MTRYRKRPVEIDAIQYNGFNADEVRQWAESFLDVGFLPDVRYPAKRGDRSIYVDTLEGTMECRPGSWVICGLKGELYPCDPVVFAESYEQVGPERGPVESNDEPISMSSNRFVAERVTSVEIVDADGKPTGRAEIPEFALNIAGAADPVEDLGIDDPEVARVYLEQAAMPGTKIGGPSYDPETHRPPMVLGGPIAAPEYVDLNEALNEPQRPPGVLHTSPDGGTSALVSPPIPNAEPPGDGTTLAEAQVSLDRQIADGTVRVATRATTPELIRRIEQNQAERARRS